MKNVSDSSDIEKSSSPIFEERCHYLNKSLRYINNCSSNIIGSFNKMVKPVLILLILIVAGISTVPVKVVAQDFEIYGLSGDGKTFFWRYDIDTDTWLTTAANANEPIDPAPLNVKAGGALTTDGNYIYGLQGDGNNTFWRYDVITNTWSTRASAPGNVNAGGALTYLNGFIYAFGGDGTTSFWRYEIATNSWTTRAAAPVAVDIGGALTTDGTLIYGFGGDKTDNFWSYNPTTNTWTETLTKPYDVADDKEAEIQDGGSLVYAGGYIYAFEGKSDVFWRYNISTDSWETLPVTLDNVDQGGSLTVVGDTIYAFRGNGTTFWSYDITAAPGGSWTLLAETPENVKWGGALTTFRVLKADLEVTKEVTDPAGSAFNPGESLTYTITVENLGDDTANEVEVVDQLPMEVTYVSDNSGGDYDPVTGIWDIGVLNANATEALTINATVKSADMTAGRTVTNTASVNATTADDVQGNNTDEASFQVNGADLGITKTGTSPDDPVVEGSSISYTVTITNNGPNSASSIEVKDALPPSLSYVSSSATQNSYNDVTGLWNVGSLANGASATLTINATVLSGGSIRNTASITNSSEGDSFLANNSSRSVIAALKNFAAGACIIDLGLTSSYNAGLKPYGLVFDLVKNNNIPVFWAINSEKSFVSETSKTDQDDFTVDGVDYRSGAFIIPADFAALQLTQDIISSWVTANPGLTVRCDQPAFEAPIHERITSMPRAALDDQNGSLAEAAFFADNRAGIEQFYDENDPDNSPYFTRTPLQLTTCDDVYIMPHADPQDWDQPTKDSFQTFINNGGWLWAACHAPSGLEGLFVWDDNGTSRTGYNLLSREGLVEWGEHSNSGTPPYRYRVGSGQYYDNLASDPFMQFIGTIDNALQGGSEEIYVPLAAGWRSTTTVAVWDPDNVDAPSPGTYPDYVSAAVAYGRAFGDPSLGMIMYEASHSFSAGSIQENIGAARGMGNWWFQAGIEFRPDIQPTMTVQEGLYSGQTIQFGIDVSLNVPNSTLTSVEWTSTCGGTFDDPTSLTPVFTLPEVQSRSECIITVRVEDDCGRANIESFPFDFNPQTTNAINDINQTPVNVPVDGNVLTNDFDQQGDGQTVTSATYMNAAGNQVSLTVGSATAIFGYDASGTVVAAGTITLNADGSYDYVPATDYTGTVPLEYTITDDNASSPATDSATLTIEVTKDTPGVNDPPLAQDDTAITEQDVNVSGNLLDNDSDPDGDVLTVTEILADTDGDGIADDAVTLGTPTTVYGIDQEGNDVVAGTLTVNVDGTWDFDPDPDFIGEVPGVYTIEDPDGLSDDANLDITVTPNAGNQTFAIDDANLGIKGETLTGDIEANDFDPEGDTQTIAQIDTDGDGAPDTVPTAGTPVDIEQDGTKIGELTVNPATGAYTWVPEPDFVGTAVIPYETCDDGNPQACATATLYLTNLEFNDTYAINDINQTPVNVAVDGNVLTNDFDQQGDGQTVTSATYMNASGVQVALTVGTPTTIYGYDEAGTVVEAGTITLNADGSYDYAPATDFTGTVPLEYTITDDNGNPATDSATLTIEVTEDTPDVNDPPLAQDDTAITEEGVTVDGNVLDNDSDPDGDTITVTGALADTDGDGLADDALTLGTPTTVYGTNDAGDLVEAGTLTLNANGTWTFVPEPGFTGDVPAEYTIEDPDGLSDDAKLDITVTPDAGNQTFANDDANLGGEGQTLTGDIEANDFDPEGDTQTIAQIDTDGDGAPDTVPTAGTPVDIEQDGTKIGELTIDPETGAYTWTPELGFVGTAVIPYQTCDDGTPQACATATLYLTNLEGTFTSSDAIPIVLTGGSCWRTLTSPVLGESYAEFFARFRTNDTDFGGLWTQGATGARFTGGDPNVFTLNSDGSDWVKVENLGATIPAGTGFLITIFDKDDFADDNSTGFPKTAVIGELEVENSSPVTVNLGTPAGTTSAGGDNDPNFQGFSMLGNPFKSTIDFDELTRVDVNQAAWVYDRNAGNWISWNGTSGDITNGLLAPGQGFVVQNIASPTSPSVTFPETAKSTGGTFVGKQQNRPDFVRLEIEGEELYSSMWLEFTESGSVSKTTGDVMQLMSYEQDYALLSSMKEGNLYDIGRFPSAVQDLQIPVMAEATLPGTYTIRATELKLPVGAELYLHDLQTGSKELLTEDMVYTFRINQAAKQMENSCFTAPQKAKASASNRFVITTASGAGGPDTLPSEYRLNQNYPNPFNPNTQITYQLPQQSDVRLEVFDMSGRQIVTLVNESVSAGTHTVTFDATNLSSGIYMYRLQAGSAIITKKLTLIK